MGTVEPTNTKADLKSVGQNTTAPTTSNNTTTKHNKPTSGPLQLLWPRDKSSNWFI